MIHSRTDRYLYTYECNKYKEIRKGDKVSIQFKDKTISGIVFKIGTKNLLLYNNERLSGKMTTWFNFKEYKIQDIQTFAKYPSNSQRYGNRKLY
ncbi:TPA: hypothetical protein ACXDAY_002134 [Clostridium botulinum]|uniref:hypothetical protein n=1 Tax=Clostridium botulinum TaxID=1491 RepID=UPI000465284A|nr:hypothetical protein [Clostridium botulinum]APR02520.1 hypothetical protein RSJ2_4053 [Clostridium botulinum]AUN01573.1 hypothetical protein RSJ19_00905 [Clostridium botulinum]MBN3359291.1 hypothetical protein [Clostridium botulinum]MBN3367116.1 hypothetical protein [Clostridium botulinum]MBN3375442.1 hypothetical protein [Clostridium botulinum]